jgi:flagellar biogenesis protein FliO
MPTFARHVPAIAILLVVFAQASFAEDRYADRFARYDEVDTQAVAEVIPEQADSTAAAPDEWQSPAKPYRRLPIRFEKVDPTRPKSAVIPAAAGERVSSEILPSSSSKPLLLKPERDTSTSKRETTSPLPSLPTLLGSVGIVVGLFMIVAWLAKRGMPKQAPFLPREALEVLGRQRFGGKQELQLLRLGNKLVLIHVAPGHVESVAEVTDPEEVDRLTGLCFQIKPNSSSRGFQQTLDQFSKDKSPKRVASRSVVDKLDISMFEGLGRSSSKTA